MNTSDLIIAFDLESEVAEFVRGRAAALAKEKHEFGFAGSRSQCPNKSEHCPHVTGGYNTTANGHATRYCCGVEGATIKIVVTRSTNGSPYSFATCRGFWFVVEPETREVSSVV